MAQSTSADFSHSGGSLSCPLNLIDPWLDLSHSRVPTLSHRRGALLIWCHPIGPELVLAHVLLLVMHHEHVAGVLGAAPYPIAAAHGRQLKGLALEQVLLALLSLAHFPLSFLLCAPFLPLQVQQ